MNDQKDWNLKLTWKYADLSAGTSLFVYVIHFYILARWTDCFKVFGGLNECGWVLTQSLGTFRIVLKYSYLYSPMVWGRYFIFDKTIQPPSQCSMGCGCWRPTHAGVDFFRLHKHHNDIQHRHDLEICRFLTAWMLSFLCVDQRYCKFKQTTFGHSRQYFLHQNILENFSFIFTFFVSTNKILYL